MRDDKIPFSQVGMSYDPDNTIAIDPEASIEMLSTMIAQKMVDYAMSQINFEGIPSEEPVVAAAPIDYE